MLFQSFCDHSLNLAWVHSGKWHIVTVFPQTFLTEIHQNIEFTYAKFLLWSHTLIPGFIASYWVTRSSKKTRIVEIWFDVVKWKKISDRGYTENFKGLNELQKCYVDTIFGDGILTLLQSIHSFKFTAYNDRFSIRFIGQGQLRVLRLSPEQNNMFN